MLNLENKGSNYLNMLGGLNERMEKCGWKDEVIKQKNETVNQISRTEK